MAARDDGRRESRQEALARLYDLDLAEDPGDLDLYLALAARAGDPVIELGVGSGRLAVPLARAGHDVVGIDLDPAMLQRARDRWASASGDASTSAKASTNPSTAPSPHRSSVGRLELVEGDVLAPRDADLGRYRLAFLALNSILLFPEPRAQAAVIEVMGRLVAPGGLVVVDAWQPQPADLVALDGRVSLEWLREDPETGRDVTKLASGWYDTSTRTVALTTIFEASEPGGPVARWVRTDRMRLASGEELVAWAEAAGLEVERLAGDLELDPYASASDRAILVARRPD